MKKMNRRMIALSILVVFASACSSRNLYFHEQAKFGVSTETRTDLSQPLSGHIGFKRTVSAAVPVKEVANMKENECAKSGDENRDECLNHGDAVSLLSNFKVVVGGADQKKLFNVEINTNFASGQAASILTSQGSNEVKATFDKINKAIVAVVSG